MTSHTILTSAHHLDNGGTDAAPHLDSGATLCEVGALESSLCASVAARAFEPRRTAGEAATAFFENGFCIVAGDKVNIGDEALKQLYKDVDEYEPWEGQLRERSPLRYTLGDYEWIRDSSKFRAIVVH